MENYSFTSFIKLEMSLSLSLARLPQVHWLIHFMFLERIKEKLLWLFLPSFGLNQQSAAVICGRDFSCQTRALVMEVLTIQFKFNLNVISFVWIRWIIVNLVETSLDLWQFNWTCTLSHQNWHCKSRRWTEWKTKCDSIRIIYRRQTFNWLRWPHSGCSSLRNRVSSRWIIENDTVSKTLGFQI